MLPNLQKLFVPAIVVIGENKKDMTKSLLKNRLDYIL